MNFNTIGRDERVRDFILPTRIVKTNVENTDSLLRQKPLQIGLGETDFTVMKNDGGENAYIVLDFGRELHGGLRLLVARCGLDYKKIRLTFGESVSEAMSSIGEKNATNDHSARDFEVTVPQLSDNTFGETGFRFVKIELLGEQAELTLKSAVAVFIYRDIPYRGSFESNDTLLNDIYDTAAYTCHLNMQTMLWDGIKRDRLVWIGDSHPEMLAIKTVFGDMSILFDNLKYAMDEATLPGWMNAMPAYSLWWLIIADECCYHIGDYSFATDNREYITGLLDQICELINDDGIHSLPSYFLDWQTYDMREIKRAGVHGLMMLALKSGARICKKLNADSTAAMCESKMTALKKVKPNAGDMSQAHAMLVLAGISDDISVVDGNGAYGMSTYMSYYILTALANKGKTGRAVDIMKEYYGAMLSVGATSFWEDFDIKWIQNASRIDEEVPEGKTDIHGDYGRHCYAGLRHSLCHGWSAGVTAFIAEQILGIRVVGEGCREIEMKPDLLHLEYAKGSYPTPLGDIYISLEKQNGKTVIKELKVPDGIEIL